MREAAVLITIKSNDEIVKMRESGRIVGETLKLVESMIKPGVTTKELDKAAYDYIVSKGAVPSFLNYRGYPATINASVNCEVIHGIPGNRRIKEGDIISIDVGALKHGFHGDAARTFPVGKVSEDAVKLINTTRECFFAGMKFARAGNHLYEISQAIQNYVEERGFSVVRDFIGHGVGKNLHEAPDVPNYKPKGRGPLLVPGMTIAVEPMVNAGGYEVIILPDGWTVETKDKSLSAHYENTLLITEGEPEFLTLID